MIRPPMAHRREAERPSSIAVVVAALAWLLLGWALLAGALVIGGPPT